MSLADLQQMGNQSGPYGGVATGHAPQQPNMGLGPNRYIPPTFNYGSNGQGSRPDYSRMDWNQMQAHYLPNMTNQGGTANTYMQQLQQMLGGFSQQYGDPNRRPQMPNFGSYNPGFGGPTSYYDQTQEGRLGAGERGYDPNYGETGMNQFGRMGAGRGMMPQFNPYMLMRNNLQGMDFNEMFDPRFATLFGGNRFGSRTPNGPKPQTQLIDGQYASGGKPGGGQYTSGGKPGGGQYTEAWMPGGG